MLDFLSTLYRLSALKFPGKDLNIHQKLTSIRRRIGRLSVNRRLPAVIVNGPAWAGMNYLIELLSAVYPFHDVAITDKVARAAISGWHYTTQTYRYRHLLNWHEYEDFFIGNEAQNNRFVFITRDPRDMITSGSNRGCTLLEQMEDGTQTEWMPFANTVQDIQYFRSLPYVHHLSYEMLAFEPEETLVELIDFIGFPKRLNQIRRIIRGVSRLGKVGQWIHHFDERTEKRFKELGGNITSALGYEPNENWSAGEYAGKSLTEAEYWHMKERVLRV